MDNFMSQAVRYDHLQRLLKQYESEALNSLRGPATLSGGGYVDPISTSSAGVSAQVQSQAAGANAMTSSEVEKMALSSFFPLAASILCHQNKPTMDVSAAPTTSTSTVRRIEEPEVGGGGERSLAADRSSAALQQEALMKDILALRGAIPIQPLPVMTPRDRTSGAAERKDTLLEGEIITCFVVGGEKRLCLPQVLNTVLKNVSMVEINRACVDLNIHCGHCTPEQLLVLKIASVVSATTASCALITKTDAERLCDYLLRQRRKEHRAVVSSLVDVRNRVVPPGPQLPRAASIGQLSGPRRSTFSDGKESMNSKNEREINVIHYCFGRCRGLYRPFLYASPSAECIECYECGQVFAPDRFVVHSHGNQERRTCHWGFDSANWRAYLNLTDEDECDENLKILDEMKVRFDVTGLTKRKLDESMDTVSVAKKLAELDEMPAKRSRLDVGEQSKQMSMVSVIPKSSNEKPMFASSSSVAMFEPPIPVLLSTYYQAALAAATATLRAATGPQSAPPSTVLPHLTTGHALMQASAQKQQSGGIACHPLDRFVSKPNGAAGFQQQQPQSRHDRPFLDEATAAAALKLLQMHGGGVVGDELGFAKLVGAASQSEGLQKAHFYGGDEKMSASMRSFNQQPSLSSSFGKEPFKKQLLHLFAAEQQQKEEEQRRQDEQKNESADDSDLNQRKSVEIIVDDDEPMGAKMINGGQRLHPTGSSETEGDVATPDTQVADELSVSSSDDGSGNGDLSLDDLLSRYISDECGLKLVRQKIAENQRFLEQKLDAVSAENRLLHSEYSQLKSKQLQQQQHQQHQQEQSALAAASLLGKNGIASFMGFLPKQYTL